jgi:hypothetical protein
MSAPHSAHHSHQASPPAEADVGRRAHSGERFGVMRRRGCCSEKKRLRSWPGEDRRLQRGHLSRRQVLGLIDHQAVHRQTTARRRRAGHERDTRPAIQLDVLCADHLRMTRHPRRQLGMRLDHAPQPAECVTRGLHRVRGVQDLLAELEQAEQFKRQCDLPLTALPCND